MSLPDECELKQANMLLDQAISLRKQELAVAKKIAKLHKQLQKACKKYGVQTCN